MTEEQTIYTYEGSYKIMPNLTIERKLRTTMEPYMIITYKGKNYDEDEVAIFSGPDAEARAERYINSEYEAT